VLFFFCALRTEQGRKDQGNAVAGMVVGSAELGGRTDGALCRPAYLSVRPSVTRCCFSEAWMRHYLYF
jgi:hypothetical protein